MICGVEVGAEGTKHIQGYVQLKKRTSLSALKKRWPRAHLEVARGKPEQNVEYCSKEGQSHEHGECLKGAGRRSDLDDIKALIDSGCKTDDIRERHFGSFIRYRKSIESDIEFKRKDRSWVTELEIIFGETGVGKSKYCFENYPDAYWKSRGEWWDGYEGQEVVIIDEFYGWLPFDLLLRLADRYPLRVPVKGGFRKFVAKKIIITSNTGHREWYSHEKEVLWAALERRITKCEEMKK